MTARVCNHCSQPSDDLIAATCEACGWRSSWVCPTCHTHLTIRAAEPYLQKVLRLHKIVCRGKAKATA